MPKSSLTIALCLALLALSGACAQAEPKATDADRVLRPGDKIVWNAPSPHFLQVGGDGLTPLDQVNKILTFSPALTIDRDTGSGDSDTAITGTVNDGADTAGVATFVFTCGNHPGPMKSQPFTIAASDRQPARTLQIRAASGPLRWLLKKDDGTEVQVSPP